MAWFIVAINLICMEPFTFRVLRFGKCLFAERTSIVSGTDTVRSDTTSNRPATKRTHSADYYAGNYSMESDMDLSPNEEDGLYTHSH